MAPLHFPLLVFVCGWLFILCSSKGCVAQERQLIVEYFDPGSVAEQKGVKPGDSILSYDGKRLISPAGLQAAEENTFDKKIVTLEVDRDGQILKLDVPHGPLGMTISMLLPDEARMLYIESWRALVAGDLAGGLDKTRSAAKLMCDEGDYLSAAWIWWTQGNRLERAEKWSDACQAYDAALKLLENANDVAARSRALSSLGNCGFKLNAPAKAQEWYEKALQIDTAMGFEWWVAGDLTQIANAALARADLASARENSGRARSLYERLAPNSIYHAGVLNNLGEVALALGDLRQAQTNFTNSLRIKERLDREPLILLSIAGTLNNLAGVALSRGDFSSARNYLVTSLEIRQRFLPPDSPDIAASLVNLGNVYHVTGDLKSAEDRFNGALAIYEKAMQKSVQYARTLSNLGNVAYDNSNIPLAQELHSKALRILERAVPDTLDLAKALINLGNTFYAGNNRDLARQYYNRALAIYRRLAPASLDVALALNNLGTLALTESRFSEAVQFFAEAVEIVEAQRSQIPATEARALLVNQRLSEYTGLLRAYVGLGDLQSAFASVERARARSLAEMIYERSIELTDAAPKELVQKGQELVEQRNALYYRLSRLDPTNDASEIESLRRKVEDTLLQQRRLIAEIRERSPKYASLQYPQPVDLIKAQAALDRGTLLLSYFVDVEQTYLFIITKSGIRLHKEPIDRNRLRSLVNDFRIRIANQGIGFRQFGYSLYNILIKPAKNEIATAERILISPDGPLHTLPFAALEEPPGALPATAQGTPLYLIKSKPIHTVVSIAVYAELRNRQGNVTQRRTSSILAVGDPVYNGTEILVNCGTQKERLEQLPYTRRQVQMIEQLFQGQATIKLDKDATASALENISSNATIIHLACHGILDNCDPYASALALSPKDNKDDGLLRAYNIAERLRLNADLVTLSACHTGEGEESKSEGILGLSRAFQYAGAKSVLVSLWRIREDSTTMLMEKFYRQLRDNQSKDEALRQAQLLLINSEQYSHPYFWAAFVLTGSWQ